MRTTHLPLLAASILAACAAPAPLTATARRYIGTATPSTPGPLCPSSTAEAQVRNGEFIFAPNEGTWVLQGILTPDGSVAADRTIPGVDKRPWQTTFDGRWTPATVIGTYKTPRCSFAVSLTAR